MSVIGRLWRRAPAWRLWLFIAAASTGLAAMFPPHLPELLPRRPSAPPGPRYIPQADTAPHPSTGIFMPSLSGTRQTLIPFAGRQVPLPQGKWSEIALMRTAASISEQGLVLVRLQSGRMTGMIMVLGTSAIERDAPIPAAACADPSGLPVHILTPPDEQDLALQECWSMRRLATAALVDAPNPLQSRTFRRLGTLGIAVPSHLLSSFYFRHSDHAGLGVTILLPDPVESAGLALRVEGWMRRWVPLLHSGFDNDLTAASVRPNLAHDPG